MYFHFVLNYKPSTLFSYILRSVKLLAAEKYVSCKFLLRFVGMDAVADINTNRKNILNNCYSKAPTR